MRKTVINNDVVYFTSSFVAIFETDNQNLFQKRGRKKANVWLKKWS